MLPRALLVWLGLMVVAIVNGTVRQLLLLPNVGEHTGHLVSSVTLSLLILLIAWLTIRWIGVASVWAAWEVGVVWLAITVLFEFVAGHYLFHHPWSKLLADYDVRQGRIWVIVLVTTLAAPRWAAGMRGILTHPA